MIEFLFIFGICCWAFCKYVVPIVQTDKERERSKKNMEMIAKVGTTIAKWWRK